MTVPSSASRRAARRCMVLLCAASLVAGFLNGCGAFRPATVPIRSIEVRSGASGRCLAVLLPGRYAAPEGFVQGGFGDAVMRRGTDGNSEGTIDLDIVAVDAHLGYYRTRTVIDRLRQDIILPARAKGYQEIWLVGTSLGGLGGMLYLREHPEEISGVLAIAPFLGDDEVVQEIENAGGPRRWKAPAEIPGNDVGRNVWNWLATEGARPEEVPFNGRLYLGWGTADRFDRSNRLLATLLPSDHVFTVQGAHDMETWNRIWSEFLDAVGPCGMRR